MTVATIEAKHAFKPVQKQWFIKLAKQLKSNFVLDRETLDSGSLKSEGGFRRIDKIFDGQLGNLLAEFNESLWENQA